MEQENASLFGTSNWSRGILNSHSTEPVLTVAHDAKTKECAFKVGATYMRRDGCMSAVLESTNDKFLYFVQSDGERETRWRNGCVWHDNVGRLSNEDFLPTPVAIDPQPDSVADALMDMIDPRDARMIDRDGPAKPYVGCAFKCEWPNNCCQTKPAKASAHPPIEGLTRLGAVDHRFGLAAR
jgi:hypothetical protein